jgi:fructokinase
VDHPQRLIVVAGEALVDRFVGSGTESEALGGGPFNIARTIARLGGRAAFLGSVSSDEAGRRLRDALAADGVDLSLVQVTDARTTSAEVRLDAAGRASYRFDLAGTSLAGLLLPPTGSLPEGTAALALGSLGLVVEPSATTLVSLVDAAAAGVVVMLDPNCRPSATVEVETLRRRVERIAQRTDVLKANRGDLRFLYPGLPPAAAARRLLADGPGLAIVTNDSDPVGVIGPGYAFDVAVPPVDVVDSVGAGDAFAGAFLVSWLSAGRGRSELDDAEAVRASVSFAIEVARIVCTRKGADPPRLAELDRLR